MSSSIDAVVPDHHIYKEAWIPVVGKVLISQQKTKTYVVVWTRYNWPNAMYVATVSTA